MHEAAAHGKTIKIGLNLVRSIALLIMRIIGVWWCWLSNLITTPIRVDSLEDMAFITITAKGSMETQAIVSPRAGKTASGLPSSTGVHLQGQPNETTGMTPPHNGAEVSEGPVELYQVLKQYSAEVRRDRRLKVPPADSVTVYSPLCGSRLELDAHIEGGRVRELGYKVRSCSLGQATTAIVARHAPGLDAATLRRVADQLRAILTGQSTDCDWPELEVFALIKGVPSRHGSALLPFQALEQLFARGRRDGGPPDTDFSHSPTFPGGNEP